MVREFVDRVFNGSAEPLLVHLMEDRKLSEKTLRKCGLSSARSVPDDRVRAPQHPRL